MATVSPPNKLSGIARLLVQEKLITEDEANAVQQQANQSKTLFITQIISTRKMAADVIAEVSARAFGFPYLNLDAFNDSYLPAKAIDPKLMQSHRVVALQNRNNVLYVAISDPTNLHALDSVQFQMGMSLSPVVVEDDKLGKWIDKLVEDRDSSLSSLAMSDDFDLGADSQSVF